MGISFQAQLSALIAHSMHAPETLPYVRQFYLAAKNGRKIRWEKAKPEGRVSIVIIFEIPGPTDEGSSLREGYGGKNRPWTKNEPANWRSLLHTQFRWGQPLARIFHTYVQRRNTLFAPALLAVIARSAATTRLAEVLAKSEAIE